MAEFDDLRDRFPNIAAGEATPAEMARLDQALAHDLHFRRDFIEFMNLDAALEDWAAGAIEVRPLTFTPQSREIIRAIKLTAAFAAAILLGWVLSRTVGHGLLEVTSAAEPLAPTLATLVGAEQCRWSGTQYYEGQRLPTGNLRLLAGSAIIRLDGGTLLLLRGDCDLNLRYDGGVDMLRGEITARSAEDAAGFVVHVPGTTVVDLGTEFALRVDAHGKMELHVVEGAVRLDREGATDVNSAILNAKRAVRIDRAPSSHLEAIPYAGEPMAMVLQRIRRHRQEHDLLAEESFNYPVDNHVPTALDGGHGWQGPWRLPTQREGKPIYPGTQRFMRIIETSAQSQSWETPAGKCFRTRSLAQPIDLAVDGVYYLGLTIHAEQAVEVGGPFEKQGRSVRLSLRTESSSERNSISFGFNNSARPIIETSAGRSFVGRRTVPLTSSVRLIAKILTRTQGEDELSLVFLDEQEHMEIEPPTWDVTTRGVQLGDQLQDVFLASHGPAARGLDDLRIGATWWSVLQKSSTP